MLDQISKNFIASKLDMNEIFVLNSFINLTHVHNYGAAFSLFSDSINMQQYFLPLASILASLVITFWILRIDITKKLKIFSLSLMLAGAVGNLIDRVFLGFVEDFVSLHYHDWSFPVFNLADTLLFFGVILLLISDTKLNKKSKDKVNL
jgi:signal peptidase II